MGHDFTRWFVISNDTWWWWRNAHAHGLATHSNAVPVSDALPCVRNLAIDGDAPVQNHLFHVAPRPHAGLRQELVQLGSVHLSGQDSLDRALQRRFAFRRLDIKSARHHFVENLAHLCRRQVRGTEVDVHTLVIRRAFGTGALLKAGLGFSSVVVITPSATSAAIARAASLFALRGAFAIGLRPRWTVRLGTLGRSVHRLWCDLTCRAFVRHVIGSHQRVAIRIDRCCVGGTGLGKFARRSTTARSLGRFGHGRIARVQVGVCTRLGFTNFSRSRAALGFGGIGVVDVHAGSSVGARVEGITMSSSSASNSWPTAAGHWEGAWPSAFWSAS